MKHVPGWYVVHVHEEGEPCPNNTFETCYYRPSITLPFRLLFRRLVKWALTDPNKPKLRLIK